jgi:hypothetical protein
MDACIHDVFGAEPSVSCMPMAVDALARPASKMTLTVIDASTAARILQADRAV